MEREAHLPAPRAAPGCHHAQHGTLHAGLTWSIFPAWGAGQRAKTLHHEAPQTATNPSPLVPASRYAEGPQGLCLRVLHTMAQTRPEAVADVRRRRARGPGEKKAGSHSDREQRQACCWQGPRTAPGNTLAGRRRRGEAGGGCSPSTCFSFREFVLKGAIAPPTERTVPC